MRNIIQRFFFLLFLAPPLYMSGQPDTSASVVELLKEEQKNFIAYLQNDRIDSNISQRLFLFLGNETDSLRNTYLEDSSLSEMEKIKALKSIIHFMYELRVKLGAKKFEVYDIPDAVETFKKTLDALVHATPFEDLLVHLGPKRSQLLAVSFWEYKECVIFEDIAFFKRVVGYPQHIMSFLENRQGFRFTDSLLVLAAVQDPEDVADHLEIGNTYIQERIRSHRDIYFQQLMTLAQHSSGSALYPFLVPLAEKRISSEEILEKRKDAHCYFQLLVSTLIDEIHRRNDTGFVFLIPLRTAIKESSLESYVEPINELHSAADAVRFASVKDMRMEDLFYIITSCEQELYTSSYLGLYKRMMARSSQASLDSLFRLVHYDQFHCFMRMAANYNTMTDMVGKMRQDTAVVILKRFIAGIEGNRDAGLEMAMDVADAFDGLNRFDNISKIFRTELKLNLDRCRENKLYLEARLYTILLKVFDLVNGKDKPNELWTNLGDPETLKRSLLMNSKGEINEVVLFFGDEDGRASFANFMELFRDQKQWKIEQNEYWVSIRSLLNPSLVIYANLPLDDFPEWDLEAQDSLYAYLDQNAIEPSILFHRGHSYHLGQTMKRIKPSVKLAILGSCGGYNSILAIADLSPDAQVIVSKKVGSKFINDPLFDEINGNLRRNKDLAWTIVWKRLQTRFKGDEFLLNLFNEYIPPSRNLSLFVFKIFNFSK